MTKYKLKIEENITLYQLKELCKFLLSKMSEDKEFDEKEIPQSIQKHFKKKI